ncbi:sporulation protein YlmC with PRC-barrel domain [Constrictibacter sp. MBR-5]|jgi:sporulation protein YlmC with PRC-barrel domain|uniref:PRC-barrel domain-containing protein n=1 Tax=Constrictibacter sp. MBR-5 TaxID=3156467 RepID=UPI003393E229
MRTPLTLAASALALAFAAAPALSAPNIKGDKVDIRTWDTTAFSNGWSVDRLIGTDVRGPGGEEIGEVENLILGPDNRVRKLVFSTGGFWDIGDKHLVVDWKEVTVAPGREYVTVPVTEETAEQYGMFDDAPETVATKQRNWRATELIGDYVRLQDDVDYGYVQDIVVDTEGKLQAVVVEPDVGYGVRPGPYAYPFYGYGYGWDPGSDYYDMPYAADEVGDLDPYEWRT